ncbi:hypothetical protein ACVWWP_005206 [Bradyrhizobium sp. LM3.6]
MAGIAGDEDARQTRVDLGLRHVVELVGQALADLVDRPPRDLLHLKCMRLQYPLRLGDHVIGGDVAIGDALAGVELGELDIEADHVAAFARDDQQAAVLRRLDQGFEADVRKIGHRQHVHHAPGMIGGIAVQLAADRFARRAARAVTADDVARLDRLDLALVPRIDPFEPHGHGMVGGTRGRIDLEIEQASAVMRLELGRRFAHDVKKAVMDPRLVEDDVREFRQPVFDVLHPAAADDVFRNPFVRLPERRLVDPASFLQNALAEAEGVEHLHGAAGDAVGLPDQQAPRLLLDDAGSS